MNSLRSGRTGSTGRAVSSGGTKALIGRQQSESSTSGAGVAEVSVQTEILMSEIDVPPSGRAHAPENDGHLRLKCDIGTQTCSSTGLPMPGWVPSRSGGDHRSRPGLYYGDPI